MPSSGTFANGFTKMGKEEEEDKISEALLKIPFNLFGIVTVSLPAGTLLFAFLWGVIFQADEVNETVCNCTNFIPSISAVTGVAPGRYAWRIGIGLHSAPRFMISYLHYNMYIARLYNIPQHRQSLYLKMVSLNFWLNVVENSMLVAVAYISNRENYRQSAQGFLVQIALLMKHTPQVIHKKIQSVHEKIFVVFMVTSLCYMLLNTILFKVSRDPVWTPLEERSYFWKKFLFASIMCCTAGLLYFFALHRIWCISYAFSWFSLLELIIAYINMGYHFSARWEFVDTHIIHCKLPKENYHVKAN